jgi:hypothetical protein
MKYNNIIIEKIKKKYHYTDKFIYSLPEKELNFIIETFKTETIYEHNNEIINNIVILFDDYDASYIWKYRTEYEQNYKHDNRYILLKCISSCKVKELNKIIKRCEIENRTRFTEFDDIKYSFLTKVFNYKKNDIFNIRVVL